MGPPVFLDTLSNFYDIFLLNILQVFLISTGTRHSWTSTSHTELQIKKFKEGEYTETLLPSLSKADFTRFQHKIFSKPITIVNTTLFVLKFFNLPQGEILTRAEKHFEELKDTSLPLPIWNQDGLKKQWKYGKLILQGKGYACISPDRSNKHSWLPLWKIRPKGAPSLQNRGETTNIPGGRNSNMGHGGSKDL